MVQGTCQRAEGKQGRRGREAKKLTPADIYEKIVGEIGFPRHDFLYEIERWEAMRLIRGYRKRYRDMWSATRWHAFSIMSSMPFCDLAKSGIHRPTDLLQFPWDHEDQEEIELPDKEEIKETLKYLNDYNEKKSQ